MASTSHRPKRPNDDLPPFYDSSSKKPRFDARNPSTLAADDDDREEDLILDADVIGKSGVQTKRNAVKIDGYESDSDNDNFLLRATERSRRGDTNGRHAALQSKDADEDDMFADLEEAEVPDGDEDEDVARQGKKAKMDVRFLDEGEIEGQVMNSRSGGHVSGELLVGGKQGKEGRRKREEDDDSSSGEDEDRDLLPEEMEEDLAAEIGAGGKKKHAPRLDAFNLKDEAEEGRFDESGNFVRKAADPDAVNDSWLDGVTKKDMKRAREAQEKRDVEQRRNAAETDALLTSDLLSTLILHLEVGETALEALQRLNRGKTKSSGNAKWKQKKRKDEAAMEVSEADADPAERARRKAVEAITGAAGALYAREQHEVYDTEREMLMRQYLRDTGDEWRRPEDAPTDEFPGNDGGEQDAMWEYRWSDARDGGELHGPYDGMTMKAWNDAGYFGGGVEFRRVKGEQWSRVLDVQ